MPQSGSQLLAVGPWLPEAVHASWTADPYIPTEEATAAADVELQGLKDRGSPSHDGLAARLAAWEQTPDGLVMSLQPARWALRLLDGADIASLSALCVVRSADGQWLAGRRADWVASWPGRWALGAGGAVEVSENPVESMTRELEEEWSAVPEHLSIEALVQVPSGMTLLVGTATLPDGMEVTPDAEHDEFMWWPADINDWPDEADAPLRAMAAMLNR
ncbi:MAG: NUDIX domain-containing protein [Actinobacteria bacterium]|nr:NUDIX domain-containing protein [Actinomycetota bacterium]